MIHNRLDPYNPVTKYRPTIVLLSEAATDFATFLSLNSNHPSVKHLPLFPPYFLRRLRAIGSNNQASTSF